MWFQFEETTNRETIHNDKNIQFITNMALDSDKELLDALIYALQLNDEYKLKYLLEFKEYYKSKGIIVDNNYDSYIQDFVKLDGGDARGSFLEVLSYKLIDNYCNVDELYYECLVVYDNIKDSHPYDIIAIDENFIHMIDIKFSSKYLDKKDLDYLVRFKRKEVHVKSYLFSMDSNIKIELKRNYIKDKYNINDNAFENLINDIIWISKEDFFSSILDNNCLLS